MSDQNSIIIFIITITALILILSVFIVSIIFLYQKKQLLFKRDLEDIQLLHDKNILKKELEIQEQTFQQVSRELHDNIAHGLILSKLHLSTLDYSSMLKSQNKIDLSLTLIGEAISNLSNISRSMSSEIIKNSGLLKALEIEVSNLDKSGIFRTRYEIEGTIRKLDPGKELILYRIVQESFNNIIKHSKADKINLLVNYKDSHLEISIEDNGVGFDTDHPTQHARLGGFGLDNIRQRTELLEGQCIIVSQPDKGTKIQIITPLPLTKKHHLNHE